ncbi:MAG: AMP-binding protein, partial [Myxococcales bacterium]|nr:AMP-binding protein [Myxococcales bacterium]
SQGGMFCYQAAAYRKSAQIRSIVTLGAPVDLRRNLPVKVHESLAERLISVARRAIDGPLKELEGLPGAISARGFKLMAPRQEVKHLASTLGLLHDRDALMATEPKRRFLGGEGFIAWPGPAFRKFVDQFVVENRMKEGGFVIAGRTVALADITAPIAYFLGTRDDMARPAAVRAIEKAAVNARCYPVEVDAGHFGLVVGSTALTRVWPTALEWFRHVDTGAPLPPAVATGAAASARARAPSDDAASSERLYDLATDVLDDLWHRLGDVSVEASGIIGSLRWQLPRLARMASLKPHSRVSLARVLAEQAEAIPGETLFVWEGRAYTYAEADARVTDVAGALFARGVRRGHHVAVLMGNHPDYLTVVGAVNRLGAVSALITTESRGLSLDHALRAAEADWLVADRAHADEALAAFGEGVMVLGARGGGAALPADAVDLEALAVGGRASLPADLELNGGRADSVATLIFTSGTTGLPKAARITNGRWIAAGLAAASMAELTPRDTVFCCLPLYHSTGMLVCVGGALIGGARLALAERFSATSFWPDVRNVGATVVFYVGELLRYLVAQPPHELDPKHPVRLFAGNGLRADVWREVLARFGPVRVLEFYSATEGNVVLVNKDGDKIGAVGRELTGRVPVELLRWDVDRGEVARDAGGRVERAAVDEAGLLVSRVVPNDDPDAHPLSWFSGYTDPVATEQKVLRDLFSPGDAWFDTGDLLARDADGDLWFVDRVGDTFRWKGENVSTELVAAALRTVPGVVAAAVYGVKLEHQEGRAGMAAIEMAPGEALDPDAIYAAVGRHLTPNARPRFLRQVRALDRTASLKVVKVALAREGADPGRTDDPLFVYDGAAGTYAPLDLDRYVRLLERR